MTHTRHPSGWFWWVFFWISILLLPFSQFFFLLSLCYPSLVGLSEMMACVGWHFGGPLRPRRCCDSKVSVIEGQRGWLGFGSAQRVRVWKGHDNTQHTKIVIIFCIIKLNESCYEFKSAHTFEQTSVINLHINWQKKSIFNRVHWGVHNQSCFTICTMTEACSA